MTDFGVKVQLYVGLLTVAFIAGVVYTAVQIDGDAADAGAVIQLCNDFYQEQFERVCWERKPGYYTYRVPNFTLNVSSATSESVSNFSS